VTTNQAPSPAPPTVLLDLDGTLSESAPGITGSLVKAYRDLDLPVPDAATLRSFVGPPMTASFRANGVPEALVDDLLAAYRRHYDAGGLRDTRVYPGVVDALHTLRAAGCTLVLATSKPRARALPVCEYLGLDPLLDDVFAAPDDDAATSKAHVVAAALAGRGPAVMVGDRVFDVDGAHANGIPCVGVTWGYAEPGELADADALVDDAADLAGTVLALLGARSTVVAGQLEA
jgi:phosphoglycolate phosphatase